MKGLTLLKRCPCPQNGKRKVAFSHAMETSGIINQREEIPLHCGRRAQYALNPQIQYAPVKGDSSDAREISMSLTGRHSLIYLPFTICQVFVSLVPHHWIPWTAKGAATRGSIAGL